MRVTIDATDTTRVLQVLDEQAANRRLPGWLRIAFWAHAHADAHGIARAHPGELRDLLDVSAHEVSRAIRLAKNRRLLADASNATRLVLADPDVQPTLSTSVSAGQPRRTTHRPETT